MQTVDHSSEKSATPVSADESGAPRPNLRAMRGITVKPIVLRGQTSPERARLQDAEDGGEAEAHPS